MSEEEDPERPGTWKGSVSSSSSSIPTRPGTPSTTLSTSSRPPTRGDARPGSLVLDAAGPAVSATVGPQPGLGSRKASLIDHLLSTDPAGDIAPEVTESVVEVTLEIGDLFAPRESLASTSLPYVARVDLIKPTSFLVTETPLASILENVFALNDSRPLSEPTRHRLMAALWFQRCGLVVLCCSIVANVLQFSLLAGGLLAIVPPATSSHLLGWAGVRLVCMLTF